MEQSLWMHRSTARLSNSLSFDRADPAILLSGTQHERKMTRQQHQVIHARQRDGVYHLATSCPTKVASVVPKKGALGLL